MAETARWEELGFRLGTNLVFGAVGKEVSWEYVR